ncbi:rab-GTPase-TBC domain-containing protein [Desarmillaria tabescens]|uniref:Rab-GTPase-TBC domain-containing protein n=1 Tax=Armillaria tabescens TaxID=1929756 RepID=A0AA39KD16_ARMTA|nr:rab-GTPase-TBC domain-containing protein [Desarmillaria tabescens]KAK0458931.1 rab-GTPase-TBC domain-containing protein [Desarmillaria tabescens]
MSEPTSIVEKQEVPEEIDWDTLRKASLFPGGFGEDRIKLWPKLLNVQDGANQDLSVFDELPGHADERQIRLDTDRSFVLYPVDTRDDKESLQAELNRLLVAIFRKRPKLNYFQGYHDIISVLFLTLPPEIQFSCAEKMSLHRVRDSMGHGLEPILGLLRVTQKLLRLVDCNYAELLERNSPLPFYALSNLITLFSHDMPTLQLIQHVFDYLLCRPPIVTVYLATAILLSRKDEIRCLEEEDEEGMIHSVLSGLPNITDESPSFEESVVKTEEDVTSSVVSLEQEQPDSQSSVGDELSGSFAKQEHCEELSSIPIEIKIEDDGYMEPSGNNVKDVVESEVQEETISTSQVSSSDSKDEVSPSRTPSPPPSYLHPESSRHALQKPSITLTSLLLQADHLYETYPPSHPSLALSVIFTWSSSPADLPSDDSAERMVEYPQLVVYPYVDKEEDGDQKEMRQGTRHKHPIKRRRRFRLRDRKTMITGAVLALGVAMAVYGVRSGIVYGEGRHTNFHFHRDWKRLGGWAGGFLIGAGNKILHMGDTS